MNRGAWTMVGSPASTAMHSQPGRLVRVGAPQAGGVRGDRLTTLEGDLGTLGFSWPWESDEPLGVDEQREAEKDPAWVGLVGKLVENGPRYAEVFVRENPEGWSPDKLAQMLGLAQQRAAGVQAGTASMPAAGWVGIGVGAVAVLGLLALLVFGRRR